MALTSRGACPTFILVCVMLQSVASFADEGISSKRQVELVRLVRNDCGSCHGLTLNGGLGPALMPENLRGKPSEGLRETILRGRAGTAMPPWSRFLSEADANWIVEQLMKGFPDVH